jgi:hypothetical protein
MAACEPFCTRTEGGTWSEEATKLSREVANLLDDLDEEELVEMIKDQQLFVAEVRGHIVGCAGWRTGSLRHVYVSSGSRDSGTKAEGAHSFGVTYPRQNAGDSPGNRIGGSIGVTACSREIAGGGGGSRTPVFRAFVGASPSAASGKISGRRHPPAACVDPSLAVMSRRATRPVPAVSRSR